MNFNLSAVEYTIEADFDDLEVRGNAVVSGDDAEDERVEDEIIERVNNGDVWAWARVKVTATWNGLEGTDYLGACSYADEEAFKHCGYFEDMKAQALEDLKQIIKSLQQKVCGVSL